MQFVVQVVQQQCQIGQRRIALGIQQHDDAGGATRQDGPQEAEARLPRHAEQAHPAVGAQAQLAVIQAHGGGGLAQAQLGAGHVGGQGGHLAQLLDGRGLAGARRTGEHQLQVGFERG
ncbi:MAG: hypothetical protein CFE46_09830 [Burkholderiales bacterium PBB6]|nr:MAG: hypothetical protein CFE46_09830 [Burkholderiales bacterium PBB6]